MNVQTLEQRETKILLDMKTMIDAAARDDAALTEEQQKTYASWEKELGDLGKQIAQHKGSQEMAAAIEAAIGGNGNGSVVVYGGKRTSRGRQFVTSKAFEQIKAIRHRDKWESDAVDVEHWATLSEDAASAGSLVPPDAQAPRMGPLLPVVVADLLAPGATSSNAVTIPVVKSFVNAAAPVGEGQLKPESTLIFEQQTEPVRKIAHHIPVTDELLEDAPATASIIDAHLRQGVNRKEDQQLLFGTGVSPQLLGILSRTGLAADVARVDPATNADAILAQIVAIEAATGLPVTGIVMNPLAWGSIISVKTSTGEYLGGGPFTVLPRPSLWGRVVSLTDQITPTVALVGAFKDAGQVFRNGGLKLAATNSHADDFTHNIVRIRCEERLALAVTRPSAFGRVTGLTVVPTPAP